MSADETRNPAGRGDEEPVVVRQPLRRSEGPRRSPRSAASVLEGVLRSLGGTEGAALLRLRERWSEVVGPSRAALVVPEELKDGVLWLKSSDYAVRTEIRFAAREIAARANAAAGAEAVRSIRFRG